MIIPSENTLPSIGHVYVFLSKDDKGNEGVCAFSTPTGLIMPMVAADEGRLDSLRATAKKICKEANTEIRLVKFHNREEMETFLPDQIFEPWQMN